MTKSQQFKFTSKSFIFFIIFCGIIGWVIGKGIGNKKPTRSSNNEQLSSQSCSGNQNCISEVRNNFTNTGKTILGEEYIGDGKFGISFMDSKHPGALFNAVVSTNCNCNIINVTVSAVP